MREHEVEIGPFPAPLGQIAAYVVNDFIHDAERAGWLAVVANLGDCIVVTARRIEPARTVRQRITIPATAGTEG